MLMAAYSKSLAKYFPEESQEDKTLTHDSSSSCLDSNRGPSECERVLPLHHGIQLIFENQYLLATQI
jgi:hypothetical protein